MVEPGERSKMHASVSDHQAILAELRRGTCWNGEDTASAATVNLVVYVDDAVYKPWVLERAVRIGEKYPSRLIVLDAADASGEAEVVCASRESSGTTIVSQRVELAIAGLEPRGVRVLVDELSVPQIPTVLWWSASRLIDHPVFNELMSHVAKVVVDSSGPTSGDGIMHQLGAIHAKYPEVVLDDLAWGRLTPWQEIVAQLFDD